MNTHPSISRRNFLATSGAVLPGSAFVDPLSEVQAAVAPFNAPSQTGKTKLAMVGTGGRGCGMWGRTLLSRYPDKLEFVGLCDINPGRVEVAKELIGANCRTYSDLKNPMAAFEKMVQETKPELLIVTTVDCFHDDYIVRGMELGMNVLTEKPMATDEKKIQRIIDAEKRTGKTTRVTFNYRYSPHRARLYELLRAGEIGEVTSIDFHWYLDTRHGADYFRRWHGLTEKGGTLWVHKASHHFDLLNWWIDSEPESVYALGSLDFYGKNGQFRGENCRKCPHTAQCQFYFQLERPLTAFQLEAAGITGATAARLQGTNQNRLLYIDHEHHDGYYRDGCIYRTNIDIFDKMAATIKYANGVQVSYSLTTYSPYEGYRIAFNGTKGRIDSWVEESNPIIQDKNYDEIVVYKNFGRRQYIHIPHSSGHGGGDNLLRDQIFIPGTPDPLKQCAASRDGAFSCLVGIAARRSIASGQVVKIADLTSLKPQVQKEYRRV